MTALSRRRPSRSREPSRRSEGGEPALRTVADWRQHDPPRYTARANPQRHRVFGVPATLRRPRLRRHLVLREQRRAELATTRRCPASPSPPSCASEMAIDAAGPRRSPARCSVVGDESWRVMELPARTGETGEYRLVLA